MKILIKEYDPYHKLYLDTKTGIAWVEDTSCGIGHTAHSNIDRTGSIRGMKDRGWWDRKDRAVHSHGFIFNIDTCPLPADEWDEIARCYCACGGHHHKKMNVPDTGRMDAQRFLKENGLI